MTQRALAVALWVAAVSQAATLLRYPYLQNLGANHVTVIWTTDEYGSAVVEYSTDPSFSRFASVTAATRRFDPGITGLPSPYFQHQAELTGLTPATEYFYRVVLDGKSLAAADSFHTAGPRPFSFLAWGDSGNGSPAQRQLARVMLRETSRGAEDRPALVLHTGDMAYPQGTFEQFQKNHFSQYRDLMKQLSFFPTPGNHEYQTSLAAPYLALHAPPADGVAPEERGRYYSFDWGNAHFVSLDTNVPLERAAKGTGAMLRWLESDLQRTRQTWKIVYFHHTAYPTSVHADDPNSALVRERVVPILDRYAVDLVLSGHEHNYQRTKPLRGGHVQAEARLGTIYVTTGGGGASLYPVAPRDFLDYAESTHHFLRVKIDGDRITVRATAIDGREIDRFELQRAAPPGSTTQVTATIDAVLNAASFAPSLAPGELVSIFGRNLALQEWQAPGLPLPARLSDVTVSLNGRPLPLLYASPTQINAQLPFDLVGQGTVSVTTPSGTVQTAVVIADAAPGIFSASAEPAAVHADGTLVCATAPALGGETLSLYLTGLGEVNGQLAAGQPAPALPLVTRAAVQVQLEDLSIEPSFAGLAPGFVGLYQVNFAIPLGMAGGRHTLRVVAKGVSSNPVSLAVE